MYLIFHILQSLSSLSVGNITYSYPHVNSKNVFSLLFAGFFSQIQVTPFSYRSRSVFISTLEWFLLQISWTLFLLSSYFSLSVFCPTNYSHLAPSPPILTSLSWTQDDHQIVWDPFPAKQPGNCLQALRWSSIWFDSLLSAISIMYCLLSKV